MLITFSANGHRLVASVDATAVSKQISKIAWANPLEPPRNLFSSERCLSLSPLVLLPVPNCTGPKSKRLPFWRPIHGTDDVTPGIETNAGFRAVR